MKYATSYLIQTLTFFGIVLIIGPLLFIAGIAAISLFQGKADSFDFHEFFAAYLMFFVLGAVTFGIPSFVASLITGIVLGFKATSGVMAKSLLAAGVSLITFITFFTFFPPQTKEIMLVTLTIASTAFFLVGCLQTRIFRT
jgi:hypothetical protein